MPQGLILSGSALYGWALTGGGCQFCGGPWSILLKVNTDGTGGMILHTLAPITEGTDPLGGLVVSRDTLYGAAQHTIIIPGVGGGYGTVFAAHTDGTVFTVLHTFTATSTNSFGAYTNSDGAYPNSLNFIGNTLYGTTTGGGSGGSGTIFSISLPPQLTITASGGNVILSWPTNVSGYTLQSTTNLGSSVVWTTNSPEPVVIGGQNAVTNPIPGAQQFYQLIH